MESENTIMGRLKCLNDAKNKTFFHNSFTLLCDKEQGASFGKRTFINPNLVGIQKKLDEKCTCQESSTNHISSLFPLST